MGKLMKGGISYGGVADVDISNEPVVLTVFEAPSNPHDGMTILYKGPDTINFINGHIYQYSESDTEWVEMETVESITISEIHNLFE